jgi:TusA-related sulfurtransferase
MTTHKLDLKGLKCPVPTLRMSTFIIGKGFAPGDILAATADCPTFEADTRKWVATVKKSIVVVREEGGGKTIEIRL